MAAMTLGAALGTALKAGAVETVGALPSMALSAGGGLFGSITAKKQQKRAHKYNLEYMDKQFQQNKEAAAINQQYAKEMYDYTSYENQRRHMEAAGLNPALMYGMGGAAGGSASGAGTMGGGSQPGTNPVSAGAQYGQITLNGMALMSEIAKNNAQANLDNAKAKKTKGVDTDLTQAEIELKKSQKKVQDEMADLTAANYFKAMKEQDLVWQEARKMAAEADIAEETKEARIEQIYQQNMLNILTGIEKIANINLKNEEAKYIAEQVHWYAYEVQTRRITADAAKKNAETLADEIVKKYKFQNQENIRAWVRDMAIALSNGADAISNFIPTKKIIKMGEKVLDRAFDAKGNSKGWREIEKEIINSVE